MIGWTLYRIHLKQTYSQLNQVATARDVLLVRGATFVSLLLGEPQWVMVFF